MAETKKIIPFSLKDAPALIEKVFPAQKLSVEAYKEQMAVQGKTLTALGSYWKGRKPLILNKACILGCLLPTTDNLKNDLEIFEKLMAMDDESFVVRSKRRKSLFEILANVSIPRISDYFESEPPNVLPESSPIDWSSPALQNVKIKWREDVAELERRRLEAQLLPSESYRKRVELSSRPEEVFDTVHSHIWDSVNAHLGTYAYSYPELVEQLGLMRFGKIPSVADTFCGSGQIPFEAARLGCDVLASDLNPVSCMLTWGSFNVIGGSQESRNNLVAQKKELIKKVQNEIDKLDVESDGNGWQAKVFLYCVETRCPQSGWLVPLLPTLQVSKGHRLIVELIPDYVNKRYNIEVRSRVSESEFHAAKKGTVRTDGRGQDPYLIHNVNGSEFRTKISTLRGDYKNSDGNTDNKLRVWDKQDITPAPDDLLQERLYCILWTRPKGKGKREEYEFRSVTPEDLKREQVVESFVSEHLNEWQQAGWVPDTRIEPGDKTDEPIRTRGWTYWHHLFNPRQLLVAYLVNKHSNAHLKFGFTQVLNTSARLTRWSLGDGDGRTGGVKQVFDNQALNTLFNYGCRASKYSLSSIDASFKCFPIKSNAVNVINLPASDFPKECEIFITDPPYGDAVKYEEILEFFIAWLRKNPPLEFADWTWDSRRALAIKGEDEAFRRGMVAAYKRMAEKMPDNGIQVIMFTHQSGSIWADMANIVWASGLQVTAAWYVVTETESALREGSYVKGTVLLVLRKREGNHKTSRSDLAWEIQEEVEAQVQTLTGLNQDVKELYRDENLFSDADLQMAGYAAALRVLTRYSIIDGKEMAAEAVRPRVKGQRTFVDELIEFAVGVANEALVPLGIDKAHWDNLKPAERFYLKMLEMEAVGAKTIDNYQNFAKAFKVRNFKPFMASDKANAARLKSSIDFGRAEMSGESEMANTVLRGTLYAIMELMKDTDGDDVLKHMSSDNIPEYFKNREVVSEMADFLAGKLEGIRPDEASSARILRDLVQNQRWG